MLTHLQTKRLKIRPINLNDALFIQKLVNSEGWLKYIGGRDINNKKEAENYIQLILNNPNFSYNIFELKESNKPIGIVTFLKREEHDFPDIGFAILPKFERQGYTFEAGRAYITNLQKFSTTETIIAITLPNNVKSINLLKKLNFNFSHTYKFANEDVSIFSLNIK